MSPWGGGGDRRGEGGEAGQKVGQPYPALGTLHSWEGVGFFLPGDPFIIWTAEPIL